MGQKQFSVLISNPDSSSLLAASAEHYNSLGKARIVDVSKPPKPNEFDIV
jgi:hypothetical protein